jgi:uncharacterized damage-inducible protein DinB
MVEERWTKATVYADMWVDPDDDPREAYSNPVGEKQTLWYYLRSYRLALEMKCDGLDATQMAQRSVPPSTMSLLGLVRHLASVENSWFQRILQAHPEQPRLYKTQEDPDFDFNGAGADQAVVDDAWATWRREVAAADEYLEALPGAELGRTVDNRGKDVSVRDILTHMVEEYARHLGHADLLRECIDGRVGQ